MSIIGTFVNVLYCGLSFVCKAKCENFFAWLYPGTQIKSAPFAALSAVREHMKLLFIPVSF